MFVLCCRGISVIRTEDVKVQDGLKRQNERKKRKYEQKIQHRQLIFYVLQNVRLADGPTQPSRQLEFYSGVKAAKT
jgi:hypothetical protein